MSLIITQNFGNLEKELESAKTDLKDLNENIKRIYGKQDNFGEKKRNVGNFDISQKQRNDSKKERVFDMPFNKRRTDPFSRLGAREQDEADDFPKPKISSRVITKEQPPASRENALAMQSRNHDLARNKRMFGSLLGTLQKFRTEEDKGVQEKRAKIEMKIEKQQLMVKEKLKEEKDTLIADRKRKQLEIKSLEFKMFKLRTLKDWEDHQKSLFKFIRTKTKPKIFFLPKTMSSKTEALLKESQQEIQREIEERRQAVNEEIKEIETRLENDLALEEGKLRKTVEGESENSDSNQLSDNENNESIKDVKEENSSDVNDRKRKRSFSPEKTLRSQVVVKRANQ